MQLSEQGVRRKAGDPMFHNQHAAVRSEITSLERHMRALDSAIENMPSISIGKRNELQAEKEKVHKLLRDYREWLHRMGKDENITAT